MAGRATISLTDIVKGAKPQAPKPRPKRGATLSTEPVTVPAPSPAAQDVSILFAGLAGIEQAAASLREGIVALASDRLTDSPTAAPVVTPRDSDERISYRLSEAAKALGVSAKVLRREIKAGNLPHRVCGRVTIISKTALDAYARGEAKKA